MAMISGPEEICARVQPNSCSRGAIITPSEVTISAARDMPAAVAATRGQSLRHSAPAVGGAACAELILRLSRKDRARTGALTGTLAQRPGADSDIRAWRPAAVGVVSTSLEARASRRHE